MTLGDLYQSVRKQLRDAGLETPDLDARLLISYALGCAPDDVLLKPETIYAPNTALDKALARRLKAEPVSKITGTREFYGLNFEVNADVLDPRADTETLVDEARKYMRADSRVLDLCTGSSCIITALLSLFPDAAGVAADVSDSALAVAARNIQRHGLEDRVQILKSEWLDGVEGTFDLITCNPPYIESGIIETLEANVRLYDPLLALDGGTDGLAAYKIVFPQIRNHLNPGSIALFEIGAAQGADVTRLAQKLGLQVIGVCRDLGNNERVVVVR